MRFAAFVRVAWQGANAIAAMPPGDGWPLNFLASASQRFARPRAGRAARGYAQCWKAAQAGKSVHKPQQTKSKELMNPSNASQSSTPSAGNSAQGASGNPSAGGVAGATQKIKDATRETVDQIKTAASDTVHRVKDQAAEMADERKTGVADRIGAYGEAVHKSAESIEGEDPNIAWLTHRAADRLSSAADYLRQRDFSQLRADAEDVARRHPVAFFGGLFAAGLVIGNLLKASERSLHQDEDFTAGEAYPRAEHVPSADQPDQDPWPSEPSAETMT